MSLRAICGIFSAILLVVLPGATGALAQDTDFPTRPITMVVGFAPGGFTANTAQIVADGMEKYLGQPVLLQHRPGAVGVVAGEFVKHARPDGYTIYYLAQGELIAKTAMDKHEGEQVILEIDDLDALGAGPYSPNTAAVNNDSGWMTIEDFIADAQEAPGQTHYGSGGLGGSSHILMELFSQQADMSLNHVPFTGGAAVVAAVLGGHVQITATSIATLGSHIQSGGGLRPLLIFDRQRDPALPDVPTATERGFDINLASWQAIRAPKNLPQPVKDKLVDAIEKTVKDPEILERLARINSRVEYLSPAEMEQRTADELELFLDTWNQVSLQAE